jgi:hypothetical protein
MTSSGRQGLAAPTGTKLPYLPFFRHLAYNLLTPQGRRLTQWHQAHSYRLPSCAARAPSGQFPGSSRTQAVGDIMLDIANISIHGFMVGNKVELGRGERVTIRLPVVGRIEAHLIWATEDRAGFQFERIIRQDDFTNMIAALQPNPRLRK